tara:strand:- start:1757 stop:3115 length:1359 start_codon:yes stop_codon:yes gene_type:complete
MTYDHASQYRAVIVRSKSLTDLDNLLMVYAEILNEISPCNVDYFPENFNQLLKPKLLKPTEKTINNHRTEIAGKLFGIYYKDGDNIVISDRAKLLLKSGDQPAFFKDLCAKFQFPSGMNKSQTIISMMENGINVRQFAFFLRVLLILNDKHIRIDKKKAGYYIFNSLNVLSRKATPEQVAGQIELDIKNKVYRQVQTAGKAQSYDMQHINEQIGLLILANVIYLQNDLITLNTAESEYIEALSRLAMSEPDFDFYQFNMKQSDVRHLVSEAWDTYFSKRSHIDSKILETQTRALVRKGTSTIHSDSSPKELGDEGEDLVYHYELNRVSKLSERLKSKVLNLSTTKGLGFDIQSVWATKEKPDSPIFIEVKSTKRVTSPQHFSDTINLTRNEWVAAETHGSNYFIYRVYFTASGNKIFSIADPYKLYMRQEIVVLPLTYRVDFQDSSGYFLDE